MQAVDLETIRTVRREIARHLIDCSSVTVSAHHGIVHLAGEVRPIKGQEAKFIDEITTMYKCLRQRPGIKDVVLDWSVPDGFKKLKVGSRN